MVDSVCRDDDVPSRLHGFISEEACLSLPVWTYSDSCDISWPIAPHLETDDTYKYPQRAQLLEQAERKLDPSHSHDNFLGALWHRIVRHGRVVDNHIAIGVLVEVDEWAAIILCYSLGALGSILGGCILCLLGGTRVEIGVGKSDGVTRLGPVVEIRLFRHGRS